MYIGIDVGTSITKAATFDPSGKILSVASRPTRLVNPQPGWYEQDIAEVLTSVTEVVAEVAATTDIEVIGLTGQGDGVWLVDEAGRPVRPAISWLDSRAVAVLRDWMATGVVERTFRRTGNTMFPGSAAPLLSWLDEAEPAVLDMAATAGYCKDIVMQHLTGVRATDVSDASLPFSDPHRHRYHPDVLADCGLTHRTDLLAPVVTPTPIGELNPGALALPAGVPVAAGPFDLPAGALGSGVREPGDGHLIIGTTLACQVLTETPDTGGVPTGMTLATGTPGQWLRAMPAMVGTAAVDWVLRLAGREHRDLESMLAKSPTGANGVRCLPFFSPSGERAPFLEPMARANFEGLSLHTDIDDLVRATCEAIAYAARHCFEAAGLTGEVAVCGGGTRSLAWLRIIADVLNRPIRLAPQPETGARGAVIAAALAHGRDIDIDAWTAPATVIEPDAATARVYEQEYARYRSRVDTARLSWKESS